MLAGGLDGRFPLGAGRQTLRAEPPDSAVGVAQQTFARGLQVARPARVAIGMAQVMALPRVEQPDQSTALALSVAARDAQLEDIADTPASPHGADEWIEPGEDAVLHAERAAPE